MTKSSERNKDLKNSTSAIYLKKKKKPTRLDFWVGFVDYANVRMLNEATSHLHINKTKKASLRNNIRISADEEL